MIRQSIPDKVSTQISRVCETIENQLAAKLLSVHLYGSALDGGLRPNSDIDLLVTVSTRLEDSERRTLLTDLLKVSALPGQSESLRPLEVTVVVHDDIVPWRWPPRRELQFGEWLRRDIEAGIFAPAVIDADLAILLTKARDHSIALRGPVAAQLFDRVPQGDFVKALAEILKLWNAPPDWVGDERNVVLTVARIWYSAATGKIVPKDVAADWVLERLPVEYRGAMREAREGYLGGGEDRLALSAETLTNLVHFVKLEAMRLLDTQLDVIEPSD